MPELRNTSVSKLGFWIYAQVPCVREYLETVMSKEKVNELEKAAKPLMDYLESLGHPHYTVIVTSTSAELVEGLLMTKRGFGE